MTSASTTPDVETYATLAEQDKARKQARSAWRALVTSPDEVLAAEARNGNPDASAELRKRYPLPVSHSPARRVFLRSPDEALADAARHGDAGAFAELRTRYQRPVIGYISRATAYTDRAALADEAFADVLDQLDQLDTTTPGAFRRWLYAAILPAVTTHRADTDAPGQ